MAFDVAEPTIEVKFSDKVYLASRLTDRSISELDTWVRGEYIRNARASISDDMSEAEKKIAIDSAMQTAAGLSAFGSVGVAMLGTLDGICRLAFQSFRKNHPELTFEKLRYDLFDPSNNKSGVNVQAFNDKFREVNDTPDTGKVKDTGKKRRRVTVR